MQEKLLKCPETPARLNAPDASDEDSHDTQLASRLLSLDPTAGLAAGADDSEGPADRSAAVDARSIP